MISCSNWEKQLKGFSKGIHHEQKLTHGCLVEHHECNYLPLFAGGWLHWLVQSRSFSVPMWFSADLARFNSGFHHITAPSLWLMTLALRQRGTVAAAFRPAEGRLFDLTVALPCLNDLRKLTPSFCQLDVSGRWGTVLFMTVRMWT